MADSKLRMQIVTALEAAGIKATEDQLNGLEKSIQKINKTANDEKLEKALGGIGGKIDKITNAVGGTVAKVSLLVGAFKTGYELGNWLFENVQKGLLGWQDPLEKLKKSNKQLKKLQEDEIKNWQYKATLVTRYYQTEQDAIDKSIAKLNAQAQTYQRLGRAAIEFANAGVDKDVQQLERERFEDIMRLQSMGEYDAAEQANKLYDVLKQELETKKQILTFDDETSLRESEMLKKQEQSEKLLEKVENLKKERWTLQGWKDELDAGLSNAEIDKNQSQINVRLKQIEHELQNAEKQANTLADDLDAYDIESATREVNRATLVDRMFLEGDKLAAEYDKSVASNGNLLGMEFTKEFVKQYNESSMASYNELKEIELNTQYLSEKLDALLQMKQ